MILPIRFYGDPVLRKVASPVTAFDKELKRLADDMIETTYDASGVGLAAPQIGVSKRLFVALDMVPTDEDDGAEDDEDGLNAQEKRERWAVRAEYVMVNPEITMRKGLQHGQDGCLSVPGLYVEEMPRDYAVTIRYQDTDGHPHTLEAEGRFAHVLQHELDHLDGLFYFDRLPGDEKRAFLEEHRRELADLQRRAKADLKRLRGEPEVAHVR